MKQLLKEKGGVILLAKGPPISSIYPYLRIGDVILSSQNSKVLRRVRHILVHEYSEENHSTPWYKIEIVGFPGGVDVKFIDDLCPSYDFGDLLRHIAKLFNPEIHLAREKPLCLLESRAIEDLQDLGDEAIEFLHMILHVALHSIPFFLPRNRQCEVPEPCFAVTQLTICRIDRSLNNQAIWTESDLHCLTVSFLLSEIATMNLVSGDCRRRDSQKTSKKCLIIIDEQSPSVGPSVKDWGQQQSDESDKCSECNQADPRAFWHSTPPKLILSADNSHNPQRNGRLAGTA